MEDVIKRKHSHVTLDGENAVENRFWSHPLDWKLFRLLCTVHVLIDFTHQPKVWHFDSIITANQNVTSCKVTMNEIFLGKVVLMKTSKKSKQKSYFE